MFSLPHQRKSELNKPDYQIILPRGNTDNGSEATGKTFGDSFTCNCIRKCIPHCTLCNNPVISPAKGAGLHSRKDTVLEVSDKNMRLFVMFRKACNYHCIQCRNSRRFPELTGSRWFCNTDSSRLDAYIHNPPSQSRFLALLLKSLHGMVCR